MDPQEDDEHRMVPAIDEEPALLHQAEVRHEHELHDASAANAVRQMFLAARVPPPPEVDRAAQPDAPRAKVEGNVMAALVEVQAILVRHNLAAVVAVTNSEVGQVGLAFPDWSTIQVDEAGEGLNVGLLESEPERTAASIDLVIKLAKLVSVQARDLVALAREFGGPGKRDRNLIVVPGGLPGVPR